MTSASSQNPSTSGTGTFVSRSANRYLYSRPTSLAEGRNAPTGGRRTTSSVSPTVTAIVRVDAPPLMTSCVSGPSTPTWSRSQAPRAGSSRSDMLRAQFALENLAAGVAGQLVVDNPEHLGRHAADVDGLDLEGRSQVDHGANLSFVQVRCRGAEQARKGG